MAQSQLYAVTPHFTVNKGRHIRIKGIHQLLWPLYDGDVHAKGA